MVVKQLGFFGTGAGMPEGFKYQRDILSPDKEQRLLEQVQELPFKEFEFQGYVGKRRVVSFGWQYDFNQRVLRQADDIPRFFCRSASLPRRWPASVRSSCRTC